MIALINKLWAFFTRLLTKQCTHDPKFVTADVLEGDNRSLSVQWCRLCGSFRRQYRQDDDLTTEVNASKQWTNPRPDWWLAVLPLAIAMPGGIEGLLLWLIVVAGIVAIAFIVVRAMGLTIPAWVIQVGWVIVAVVVGVVAIKFLMTL